MPAKFVYLRPRYDVYDAQQLAMEETLQKTQARLDATAGQQNPTPATAPASNPIVFAKPQPFDGTCGATAKAFVGQIDLHAITYPKCFPTDASKVVFSVFFMKDYTATWSQPYLDKVSTRNRWSLMTSSMILNPASSITTAVTVTRWPCGNSARLEPLPPHVSKICIARPSPPRCW
ncbi:uncharacterized protein VP01_8156g1 [Puccinia sorghi]|uniref:Retrotransposon gag domain-containing protein n=1 Tax=Puccinia sorghi TaxID=27349 RepID=A0A0L6UA46_9BASI|nr:uncharacterized protein VP01_8156g1 [Puccinia sorghi]